MPYDLLFVDGLWSKKRVKSSLITCQPKCRVNVGCIS